jgi:hypothetical protein
MEAVMTDWHKIHAAQEAAKKAEAHKAAMAGYTGQHYFGPQQITHDLIRKNPVYNGEWGKTNTPPSRPSIGGPKRSRDSYGASAGEVLIITFAICSGVFIIILLLGTL